MVASPRRRHPRLHLRRRADLVNARRSIEPANGVLQRPRPGMDRHTGGRLYLSEYRPRAQLEQGAATARPAAGPPAGHAHPVRGAARTLGVVYWRTERDESHPLYLLRDRGRLDLERGWRLRDRCDERWRLSLVATAGRPPNLRRLADQRKIQHAGRSVAWLTRMLWEHEIPGSNPGAPTRFQEGLTRCSRSSSSSPPSPC